MISTVEFTDNQRIILLPLAGFHCGMHQTFPLYEYQLQHGFAKISAVCLLLFCRGETLHNFHTLQIYVAKNLENESLESLKPSPSVRFLLKFVWYRPGLLNGPPQSSAASCVVRSKITAVATGISGGFRRVRKVGPESTAPADELNVAIPQRLQRCRREPRVEGSLISRKSTGAQNSDRRI